jgi:DNA-binding NarL/FixJ family response regulator
MDRIKVLLVDDHALFRKGVASALALHGDIEVVGEAENGDEALAKARDLMPDVILMDISMPVCDGLAATRRIRAEVPTAKIIMLTVAEQEGSLFEAIKIGAYGYLLKTIEPRPLVETLRGVLRGEAPVSRITASKILAEFTRCAQQTGPATGPRPLLTAREREVLALVARGYTNKEVAAALGISHSTVKNHLQNILDKLHLENRVQAAAFALREGLTPGRPTPFE